MEMGESIEQGAEREAKEEANLNLISNYMEHIVFLEIGQVYLYMLQI